VRPLPPALLLVVSAIGAGFVGDAVLRGQATLAIVVIVPVITGSSPELLAGVGLILAGFLGWAVLAAGDLEPPARSTPPRGERPFSGGPSGGSFAGGVVLIGPVPIFLGGYRPGHRRVWWAWVAAGLILTGVVWFLVAVAIYFR